MQKDRFDPGTGRPAWSQGRIGLAFLAPCAVIAVAVWFIVSANPRTETPPQDTAPAPSAAASVPEPAAAAVTRVQVEPDAAVTFDDERGEDSPPTPSERRKRYANVHEAAAQSCSTASIDALSRQLVEQSRCIDPKAFVPLPSRPNLVVAEHVLAYLDASARDHLLRVIDKHKDKTLKLNSALRTVAQQYLVWRWGQGKRCGVQLANRPGESQHETGLAIDVAQHAQWRSALGAERFKWLGDNDRVHFDFERAGGPRKTGVAVLAFQQLWNRNHPEDKIAETGRFTTETEERLKKAPAAGFALGPSCRSRRGSP